MLTLMLLCLGPDQAFPQHMLEARGADTRYRYFDWNYTFSTSVIVDAFYVGVPGSNEFNLGGGYGIKIKPSLTVAPLLYAVLAKEAGQKGVKIGLLVAWEKHGWKANSFLAHFAPLAGDVPQYQVLDTLDFSRTLKGRWEAGMSAGFFHADGEWNPQVGPLLKINDRFGAWALSYRFGPQQELRFGRILILK
jgi:hypothetical protein